MGTSRFVYCIALATSLAASAFAQPPEDLEGRLDALVPAILDEEHIPGAAVVVVHDGEIVLARGYGFADLATQTRVDHDATIFRIGSISKALTATALTRLIDAGELGYGDPVQPLIPGLRIENRFSEPVRIEHLLTHTAGFDQIGTGRQSPIAEGRPSLAEFLEGQLIVVRPPGQASCYDTYGITLAGHLLERLHEKPYERIMRDRLFEPLGMEHSFVETPAPMRDRLATGYGYEEERGHGVQPYEWYITTPASSIDATSTDMGRFMAALLGDPMAGAEPLLSDAMLARVHAPQFRNHPSFPGFTHGLWWDEMRGEPIVFHGGTMRGYSTSLTLFPGRSLGVYTACNRDGETGPPVSLHQRVLDAVADAMLGDADESTEEKPAGLAIDTARFAGHYADALFCHTCFEGEGWDLRRFSIEAAGEGVIEFWGSRWLAVEPLVFEREEGAARIAFREDADGHITHMFLRHMTFERLDERQLGVIFGEGWRDMSPPPPLAAVVHRVNENWPDAGEAYAALAGARPEDGNVHFHAGRSLLLGDDPERAIPYLRASIRLDHEAAEASYLLACALAATGDTEGALSALEVAVERGYDDAEQLDGSRWLGAVRSDPRYRAIVRRIPGESD